MMTTTCRDDTTEAQDLWKTLLSRSYRGPAKSHLTRILLILIHRGPSKLNVKGFTKNLTSGPQVKRHGLGLPVRSNKTSDRDTAGLCLSNKVPLKQKNIFHVSGEGSGSTRMLVMISSPETFSMLPIVFQ